MLLSMRATLLTVVASLLIACPDGAGDDDDDGGEGEGESSEGEGELPPGLAVGEPCDLDEECSSAACIEVCRCNSDLECTGNDNGPFCGQGLLCGPCRENADCSPDGNPAGFACDAVIDGLGETACFEIQCLDDAGCGNNVCERACDAHTLSCQPPAQAGETCARFDEDVCEDYTRTCDDGLACTAPCDDGGECLACE